MAIPPHSASASAFTIVFFIFHLLLPRPASCKVVLEEGYTVTTVLDGNKNKIHPFDVLPQTQDDDLLLLLDHQGSAFYTLSPDGKINQFSGNGFGFLDGDVAAAKFNSPRSFTVDSKGNVYVADKTNHAIRKISRSRVTTIAGGYSSTTGHRDGPAQNATFSNDFSLSFVPKICALMITDRGTNFVRQMYLKPEDCAHESQVELSWPWVALIGLICLLSGSVAGFVGRSCLVSHDISSCSDSHKATWNNCWSNIGKQIVMVCSASISAIAKSAPVVLLVQLVKLSLALVSLMFCHHWNCVVGYRRLPVAPLLSRPRGPSSNTVGVGGRVRRQNISGNSCVGLALALPEVAMRQSIVGKKLDTTHQAPKQEKPM